MNRDLALIALSLVTWGVGEGMFFYFQPLYLEQLGADPIAIGAILGGYGVAMTVAHIPAGFLADRVGRKPVMAAAWMLGTLAAWVMALANSLPVFVTGLLLYGVTLFVVAPLNSYVTAARGRWSTGRTITLISASFNLGAVLGPWLGGQIGEAAGLRMTYLLAACLFLLSTAVFLFIRPQPVERRSVSDGWRFLAENLRFRGFLVLVFLAMFAMYLPQPLSPNYLQNEQGVGLGQIGTLYTLTGVGIVSLSVILGHLNVRLGFVLSQLAVGVFALTLWQGAGFGWYAVGYFLLGGYRTARSLAIAHAQTLVPTALMGLAYGMTETVGALATVLAPILAGVLYARAPVWMYVLTALFTLIAVVAFAGFTRERNARRRGGVWAGAGNGRGR